MTEALLSPVDCRIMGVLNVTPDSFSDGGKYLDAGLAWNHIHQLVAEGADIIDIGAESSRPGAASVPTEEEWSRIKPVLERISKENISARFSIDTRKPELMLRAIDLGVNVVNDIEGGRDQKTLTQLARNPDISYICMHMHGDPRNMQTSPLTGTSGLQVIDRFFADKLQMLVDCGFQRQRIYLDPGFGFGKTDELNAKILAATSAWKNKGYQIAIGVSRKSFFGRTLAIKDPELRDAPSKICEFSTALMGASIIRTHNVRQLKNLLVMVNTSAGNS
jgi:dihydropteroate synthase